MSRPVTVSVLLVAFFCVLGALGWYLFLQITQPLHSHLGDTVRVKPGTGIASFSRQLAHDKLVTSSLAVRLAYLAHQIQDSDTTLQAGVYNLNETTTLYHLLGAVRRGQVVQNTFTIIPGWNKRQLIDALVSNRLLCDVTLPLSVEQRDAVESKLLAEFAPQYTSIEGVFLADSYRYTKECDLAPLRLARNTLVDMLANLWKQRTHPVPLKNEYQALTLASIIEKETGLAAERPIIAAVFLNRLNKRIRLQTDPTVIYGLGDAYKGNITSKHLRQKTAYNTYVIRGLPPTPISMVSKAALQSVFAPAKSEYLYFVGKGDGSHHFSRTYVEHKAAVKKYQIRGRKKNYRSSPPTPTPSITSAATRS